MTVKEAQEANEPKEFDPTPYNNAAAIAAQELRTLYKKLDAPTVSALMGWWTKYFLTAGHKRLYQTVKAMSVVNNGGR